MDKRNDVKLCGGGVVVGVPPPLSSCKDNLSR